MNTSPESREYWRAVEDDRQPRPAPPTEAQVKDLYELRDRAKARRRFRQDQAWRQSEEQYHDYDK